MTEETLKKANKNRVIRPARLWPDRMKATLFLLFLLVFSASSIVILKNDLVNKKIKEAEEIVLDYIGKEKFLLEDIIITGRNRTTYDEILEKINLNRGDNLLKADIAEIKQKLETLPWVRDVAIKRSFFPNVISVDIKEKEVLALWQLKEKFYPLDMDGYVIEVDYLPKNEVLLVVGENAAEKFVDFIEVIKNIDDDFVKRIKVANYISKRRWNVILDDVKEGVTIKLPEKNYEAAWKKLIRLEKTKGILKRKLTIIDLRSEGKVVVRLNSTNLRKKRSEHNL